MTDLTIGGETFNVLIEGDDALPVLMLSNSLGTDLHLWDGQMPDLLKHFRVVRYNSRGHGGSVADDGPYSIDILGRDALAILDALGLDKVFWMGISKGGAVGQWLMINAPERIERAVLANTAARFGAPEGWNQRIALVRREGMAALVDTIMQRWFSDAFVGSDAALTVKEALLDTPAVGYAACCAALRDLDLREGIRTIRHPVLVIAGDDDLSVSKAQTDLLAETIPDAVLVTLRTRHISNVEDPAGFTKACIDFLTAKTPVRRTPARKTGVALLSARRPAGRRLTPSRGAVVEPHGRRASAKPVAQVPVAQVPVAQTVAPERAVGKAKRETGATAPKAAAKTARAKLARAKLARAKLARAKSVSKPKVVVKKAAPTVDKSGKPKVKVAASKKPSKGVAAPVAAKGKAAIGKSKIAKAPAPKVQAAKVAAPKTSKAAVRKPSARIAAGKIAKAPALKTKKTPPPKSKIAARKTKTSKSKKA